MKILFAKYIVIGLIVFLGGACRKDDPVLPEWSDRTILVYMAADNNLNSDAAANINKMLKGMEEVNGRLVIYIDPLGDVPRLLSIKGGKDCVLDTVETYPEENSASVQVLSRVIEDTRRLFPAHSYGLILWSHGLAWLPATYSFPGAYSYGLVNTGEEVPRTKYFGEDETPVNGTHRSFIDTRELHKAVSGKFSFILFDACFMSSIEVLYELRNKTDYFIASPAEVIADGFPYDKIMTFFGGNENDLKQICREFYNYYASYPGGGQWQSAAIALTKASELEPLVVKTREILSGKTDFGEAWTYPVSRPDLPRVFFDLNDYIRNMATEAQYAGFKAQLEKTVIYKAVTPKFFGKEVPADKFSGLSTYIPFQKWSSINSYYYTYQWPEYVYSK